MFVPVSIQAQGEHVYQTGFQMMERQARDMTIPLSVVGGRLVESVGAQFGTEGAWSGDPWAELTEKYQAWKEKHVPGLPKLVGIRRASDKGVRPATYVKSGYMREQLLDMRAISILPTRLTYAPEVADEKPIAGFHQGGTDTMVARPPVQLTVAELHEWDRSFVRWLNGLITTASLG